MTCRPHLLALPLLLAGCIERTVSIESEPAGAAVYFDHQQVGQTPLSLRYAHYGSHSLMLIKHGYQPYRGRLVLDEKGWAVFPLDVVTEALLPLTIHDQRRISVTLPRAPAAGETAVKKETGGKPAP